MIIENGPYTVYMHTNKINGKIYIGSTKDSVIRRWNNGTGYKQNKTFYKDIQEYGWENFEHEIIASNLTKDEAMNFETLLINKLESTDENKGYNKIKRGYTHLQSESSKAKISKQLKGTINDDDIHKKKQLAQAKKETREKISNSLTGRKLSEETKAKMKAAAPFRQIRRVKCVETGVIYDNSNAAAKETGANDSTIRRCCKGEKRTSGGFHWTYV